MPATGGGGPAPIQLPGSSGDRGGGAPNSAAGDGATAAAAVVNFKNAYTSRT